MTSNFGFTLIEERNIPEINSRARLFRHDRTGAELLSLENDDENKSFMVGFQTPPPDDTGVPHILEHSVLCGSRKYPVKEPFVQLLKTSLQTFLNAMTFDDMTVYPIASTNLRDFYNLVDVYMDAVFYPLITPETLLQEGWHYETNGDGQSIIYKGVVFNEMKAAYSSPDRKLSEMIDHSLYPDTPYALSSGGDPEAIPELTYEKFKWFHETYYHPSNARIVFSGDDDPEERLRYVNEFLAEFDYKAIDSALPLQARFDTPKMVKASYDAGDADASTKKSMVSVNWMMTDVTDRQKMLELSVLAHSLISMQASPLRKILLESGLGEGLAGGGMDNFKRQASFSIGLKNIHVEDAEKVEALVLDTLGDLAENGIDPATIAASLNTIEFSLRERNTGGFPRGLATAIGALPTWMHGGNPLDAIAFEDRLAKVKDRFTNDPAYVEGLIGEYFLNNPHRTTTVIYPDPQVAVDRDNKEKNRLIEARQLMNEDDFNAVVETQKRLKLLQETPDAPEELAKVPSLTLADIDRQIKVVPQEITDQGGTRFYFHDQPTSGIVYLDVAMDMRVLSQDELPYLELFAESLTKLGTTDQDFVALSQRIGGNTGGLGSSPMTTMKRRSSDFVAYLDVRGKVTIDHFGDLLSIISDILHKTKFDNRERFKQILLERKTRLERSLPMSGQSVAGGRIRAHYTIADWIDEEISGLEHLFFLRDLINRLDDDWAGVVAKLEGIRDKLLNRQGMLINLTMEASQRAPIQAQVEAFVASLPDKTPQHMKWDMGSLPRYEGLTLPLQVNFNGKGANLYELGYQLHGSVSVIVKHLNMDYMWHKIRVQGGAYGGRGGFSPITGLMTFLSWRDPNTVGTLANFDGVAQYLQQLELSDEDLEKAIIGTIGTIDSYSLPDAKASEAFMRHLLGYTDEERQQYRDEVIGTKLEHFREFGRVLEKMADHGVVAIVGSPESIQSANDAMGGKLTITKVQ